MDIVPVSNVSRALQTSEILLKHHGLGALGARALGKVLENNAMVVTVDLTGNCMYLGGCYFALSLCKNNAITYLNLSDNSLKYCAKELSHMLMENSTISSLILSSTPIR